MTGKRTLTTRRQPQWATAMCAAALGVCFVAVPAAAQPIDAATQSRMTQVRDAQASLASALSRLASNGRDPVALLDAGRASLVLEDAKSAASFLVRADEVSPENPDVKAALGSAMLGLEDARSALSLFERARLLGASERLFLSDRGLALDMIGDQRGAQRDYEMALALAPSDETTRRYALSLGIAGQTDRAVSVLVPLLKAQDRAAWRARAFVLAMAGRTSEADEIVRATMPGELATTITPYLSRMNRLTPAQQAAAVHFGTFPPDNALGPPRAPVLIAAATPPPAPPAATTKGKPAAGKPPAVTPRPVESPNAAAARPPKPQGPVETRVATVVQPPPIVVAPPVAITPPPVAVTPPPVAVTPPVAVVALPTAAPAEAEVRVATVFTPPPPVIVTPAAAVLAPPAAAAAPPRSEPSLADIAGSIAIPDAELAQSIDALDIADLDRLRAEKRRAEAAEAAEAQRATTAAKAKADADAKAKEAADDKKRNPARAWVQVATGADAGALASDFRRLAKKYPDAFKGQSGATAEWNRTRRLLVGPFKDGKAAQAWLSVLKKAGGDGFAWTSDAGQSVDKIGAK